MLKRRISVAAAAVIATLGVVAVGVSAVVILRSGGPRRVGRP